MDLEERIKRISENFRGDWIYKQDEVEITLQIDDEIVKITQIKNGEIIESQEVSSKGHYIEYFLCFPGAYNVNDAGPDYLIFGKQKSSLIGDYEWCYKFVRMT